jgi:hypothetical protein
MIESMTHAGVRPMQNMAAIEKEDPDVLISTTDIRSERKAIREKHLNGRSLIVLNGRSSMRTLSIECGSIASIYT